MKAKKVVSTDKDTKVVIEMDKDEAVSLLDALSTIRKLFEYHGFDSGFDGQEYEMAKSTEYFKSLLEL